MSASPASDVDAQIGVRPTPAHAPHPRTPILQNRLHANARYHNMATFVNKFWFLEAAYYGADVSIVHAPRRLRACPFESVAIRGHRGRPLTVVVVDRVPMAVVHNLRASLERHSIQGAVYMALTESTFVEASKTLPLAVIPAFSHASWSGPTTSDPADRGDKSAGLPYATKSWPRPDDDTCAPWAAVDSPAAKIMQAASTLLKLGYAPFVIDAHSFALGNYDAAMAQLPPISVYTSRDPEPAALHGEGRTALPGAMFFPASGTVRGSVATWARALASNSSASLEEVAQRPCSLGEPCSPSAVTLKRLPRHAFVEGGPRVDLAFPVKMGRGAKLYTARERGARGLFEMWQAGAFADAPDKLACDNYTMAFRRPIDVSSTDVPNAVARLERAALFAAAHGVDCVVLPGFAFMGRSRATIFSTFDADAVFAMFSGKALVPSVHDIDLTRAVHVPMTTEHARASVPRGSVNGAPSPCRAGALEECAILADSLRSFLRFAKGKLSPGFVCTPKPTESVADLFDLWLSGLSFRDSSGAQAKVGRWRRPTRAPSSVDVDQGRGRGGAPRTLAIGKWRHVELGQRDGGSVTTLAVLREQYAHRNVRGTPRGQPLASEDDPVMDEAWSDLVESAICAGAAGTADAVAPGPAPSLARLSQSSPTLQHELPPAAVNDASTFAHWLKRPDRPSLRGPFLVLAPTAGDYSCSDWVQATSSLLVLGHTLNARVAFAPALRDEWAALVDAAGLHRDLAALLPHSAAIWLQPRLAAALNVSWSVASRTAGTVDGLLSGLVAGGSDSLSTRSVIDKLRARVRDGVVWEVAVADDLPTVLLGVASRDWVVLRGSATDLASLTYRMGERDRQHASFVSHAFTMHAARCIGLG